MPGETAQMPLQEEKQGCLSASKPHAWVSKFVGAISLWCLSSLGRGRWVLLLVYDNDNKDNDNNNNDNHSTMSQISCSHSLRSACGLKKKYLFRPHCFTWQSVRWMQVTLPSFFLSLSPQREATVTSIFAFQASCASRMFFCENFVRAHSHQASNVKKIEQVLIFALAWR